MGRHGPVDWWDSAMDAGTRWDIIPNVKTDSERIPTPFWSDFFGKNPSESWGFQIPKMKLWNFGTFLLFWFDTVDGRNAAPVDMVDIPLFAWFFVHPRWCRICSINSNWAMSLNKDGLGLRLENPLPNFLNSGFGHRKIWLYSVGCDLATVKGRTAEDLGDVFCFFSFNY